MRLQTLMFLGGIALVAAVGYAFITADDVPKAAQRAKAVWGSVETEFRNRAEFADTIIATIAQINPGQTELVDKVKSAQGAVLALKPDATAPADITHFRSFMKVQDALSANLGLVMDMLRLYPDKARTDGVAKTFAELELKESHIVVARSDYVELAGAHNNLLKALPQSWVAAFFHPDARPLVASFDPAKQ